MGKQFILTAEGKEIFPELSNQSYAVSTWKRKISTSGFNQYCVEVSESEVPVSTPENKSAILYAFSEKVASDTGFDEQYTMKQLKEMFAPSTIRRFIRSGMVAKVEL